MRVWIVTFYVAYERYRLLRPSEFRTTNVPVCFACLGNIPYFLTRFWSQMYQFWFHYSAFGRSDFKFEFVRRPKLNVEMCAGEIICAHNSGSSDIRSFVWQSLWRLCVASSFVSPGLWLRDRNMSVRRICDRHMPYELDSQLRWRCHSTCICASASCIYIYIYIYIDTVLMSLWAHMYLTQHGAYYLVTARDALQPK